MLPIMEYLASVRAMMVLIICIPIALVSGRVIHSCFINTSTSSSKAEGRTAWEIERSEGQISWKSFWTFAEELRTRSDDNSVAKTDRAIQELHLCNPRRGSDAGTQSRINLLRKRFVDMNKDNASKLLPQAVVEAAVIQRFSPSGM